MSDEIERRFLVREIPQNLEDYVRIESRQGYLAVQDYNSSELRIRQKKRKGETTYLVAIKTGKGLKRGEAEIEVPFETFVEIWPHTICRRVEKTRYEIPHGSHLIELDLYHGKLDGFATVDVEFKSIEISESFVPPPWFGREITEDIRYNNKNLAIYGVPPD